MTFTSKEQAIYNMCAEAQGAGIWKGFEEIESELGIDPKVARGVVSSLQRKGVVKRDEDDYDIVWAHDRKDRSFVNTREDAARNLITDDEVAE